MGADGSKDQGSSEQAAPGTPPKAATPKAASPKASVPEPAAATGASSPAKTPAAPATPPATQAAEPAVPAAPAAAQPVDPPKADPVEAKPVEAKLAEVAEAKPAEAKPVEPTPESKPAEAKPAETKPAEAKPPEAAAKLEPQPAPKVAPAPASPKKTEAASPASPDEKKPLPPGEVKSATPATETEEKPAKGKNKGQGKGTGGKLSSPPGTKIMVKNLSEDMTTESLKKLCEAYGGVAGIDLKTKEDGTCSGLAFVTFSAPEEASKAIAATNGTTFGDKTLQVTLVQRRERQSQNEGDAGKGKGKGKGGEKGGEKGKGKGKDKGKGKGGPVMGTTPSWNAQAQQPQMHQQQAMQLQQQQQQQLQQQQQQQQMNLAYMQQMNLVSQMNQTNQVDPMYFQRLTQQYQATMQQMYGGFNPYAAMMQQYSAAVAASPTSGVYPQQQASWPTNVQTPAAAPTSGNKEYVGILKSVSQKNGFGFIKCEELWNIYSRDVWVDQNNLPKDAKANDRVRFEMVETLRKKKNPTTGAEEHQKRITASNVRLIGSG